MSFPLFNRGTGETVNFNTKEERDNYVTNHDLSVYQGLLGELIVRTPEAQKQHEQRVKDLSADRDNPEAMYRLHDRLAMSNPANPYTAAKGWIGFNTAILGTALPLASSPMLATGNIIGNVVGNRIGNYASDYLYSNPDNPISLNIDTSITPRLATSFGTGLVSGIGLGKFLKYGTTERVIGGGAESPEVISSPFSIKVRKRSVIPPEDMKFKNDAGFLRSEYKGLDLEGYYIYELPKAWMPKNPKIALRLIVKRYAKKGYYPTDIENVDGPTLINPVTRNSIGDLNNGTDLVGWSLNKWLLPKAYIVDGASLPVEDMMALKKGGKLNARKK